MKQMFILDLTEEELDDLYYKLFRLRMGPPDDDNLYHILLETEATAQSSVS